MWRGVDRKVLSLAGDVRRTGCSMRPPVGWNDAEEIAVQIIVENRHLAGGLNNALWRTNPGDTRRPTDVGQILMNLVLLELFHFRGELRLVDRRTRMDLPEAGK